MIIWLLLFLNQTKFISVVHAINQFTVILNVQLGLIVGFVIVRLLLLVSIVHNLRNCQLFDNVIV